MASNSVSPTPQNVDIFAQVQSYIDQKKVPEAVKALDSWLCGNKNITQEEAVKVHQCVQNILSALTPQASELGKQHAEALKGLHRYGDYSKVQAADAAFAEQLADVQELVSSTTKIDMTVSKLLNKKVSPPLVAQAKATAADKQEARRIERLAAREAWRIERLATGLTNLLPPKVSVDRETEPLKKFLQEQSKDLCKIVPLVLSRLLPDAARIRLETLLHELYPQSDEYFNFSRQGLVVPRPKGMELAVSYLQKKGALSLPCEVCDVSYLSERLIQLAQKNDNVIHTFITKKDGHWAPVMFYRSDDQKEFRMVVTDSAYSSDTHFPIANYLEQDLQDLAAQIKSQTGKPCRLLVFNELRQRDENNCGIFSLHDVIRYSKNTELIKKYYENLIQVARDILQEDNVLPMYTLPHYGFMRSAQSIKQIEKHLAASVQHASKARAEKLREKRARLDVKDYMEVEVRNEKSNIMEQKKRNLFIARQSQKYAAIIWQHILSAPPKS